ncbi:unnamed protein product [Aspergillus oryzae var. brunneus]|uniref:Unnamed protein product n=2 Tax=Aspergillus oryzae TaxID=5062 RepID=A0AAN5BZV5_ASPOZ|nr:unnamed protein product [Aspergillus oryzae]GMG33553.1 unnamed protein product [Aspergillus oryzae]GMG48507.1 unnamed protein product [Aspergillus oryzae var. brunneus]
MGVALALWGLVYVMAGEHISFGLLGQSMVGSFVKLSSTLFPICLTSIIIWSIRQPKSLNRTCADMLPERVYQLCHSSKTVSSELARDPNQAPTKVFHKLYSDYHVKDDVSKSEDGEDGHDSLQKALECGNWGPTKPSNLFLKVSEECFIHGIAPLTIVAPLPDLCRHMANCIARAETEVFLGTNFWIHSDASTLVTNAFRELSKRAGERGTKVVVKMIYDRGDPRQAYENRLDVPEKKYTSEKVQLPPAEEVPNIDLQVVNYHRPIFGTFHAKFMVVDRRIALLQSSNVQDNDNLEMMVRLEGPIVDAFYDTALISWGKHFDTPFPMLSSPAAGAPIPSLSLMDVSHEEECQGLTLPEHTTLDQHYDLDLRDEARRVNGTLKPRPGESKTRPVTRHLISPEDGCWHDASTGVVPEGSIGVNPGRFSWAKGVVGAVQRVRGAGGF